VWMTSAQMSRSATVDTTPERAWSLLASPAVHSIGHAYGFVFELPVRSAAGGRMFFTVGRGADRGTGQIFEVTDEIAGQRIRVLGRSALHAAQGSVSAAIGPSRHGVHIELGLEMPCPRAAKTEYQRQMARNLKDRLAGIKAVLEDRAPWPPAELPDQLRQAIGTAPPMERPLTVSDSVHIDAPPAQVWQAASSPEAGRMSQRALYGGHVPGASLPDRRVAYMVADRKEWGLLGAVSVLTEFEPGRLRAAMAKGYRIRASRLEVTAAGNGSTLEIALTEPGPAEQATWDAVQAARAASLTAQLGRYKTLIEGPEVPG
jgi:Polyketide cyclase / dehydrase and lipid transport